MYALYLVGPIVERWYGGARFLLFYLLCAAGGSIASFVFGSDAPSVGASGAIFGLFGLLLAANWFHHPVDRQSRMLVQQLGFLILSTSCSASRSRTSTTRRTSGASSPACGSVRSGRRTGSRSPPTGSAHARRMRPDARPSRWSSRPRHRGRRARGAGRAADRRAPLRVACGRSDVRDAARRTPEATARRRCATRGPAGRLPRAPGRARARAGDGRRLARRPRRYGRLVARGGRPRRPTCQGHGGRTDLVRSRRRGRSPGPARTRRGGLSLDRGPRTWRDPDRVGSTMHAPGSPMRIAALTRDLGSEVHLTIAITDGNADALGIDAVLAGAYASLAVDLIDGPENWRLAVAVPTERGVICGALSAHAGTDDGPETLLWAARYAAGSKGRGMARVGLATSGSLAALSWDQAATKVRRLGDAARIVTLPAEERRVSHRSEGRRHPLRRARSGRGVARRTRAFATRGASTWIRCVTWPDGRVILGSADMAARPTTCASTRSRSDLRWWPSAPRPATRHAAPPPTRNAVSEPTASGQVGQARPLR